MATQESTPLSYGVAWIEGPPLSGQAARGPLRGAVGCLAAGRSAGRWKGSAAGGRGTGSNFNLKDDAIVREFQQ